MLKMYLLGTFCTSIKSMTCMSFSYHWWDSRIKALSLLGHLQSQKSRRYLWKRKSLDLNSTVFNIVFPNNPIHQFHSYEWSILQNTFTESQWRPTLLNGIQSGLIAVQIWKSTHLVLRHDFTENRESSWSQICRHSYNNLRCASDDQVGIVAALGFRY